MNTLSELNGKWLKITTKSKERSCWYETGYGNCSQSIVDGADVTYLSSCNMECFLESLCFLSSVFWSCASLFLITDWWASSYKCTMRHLCDFDSVTVHKDCTSNSTFNKDCTSKSAFHKDCTSNSTFNKDCTSNSAFHKDCTSQRALHKDCTCNSTFHKDYTSNSAFHKDCTSESTFNPFLTQ